MAYASLWPGWGSAAKRDLSNLTAHPDSAKHTKVLYGDGTFQTPAAASSGAGVDYAASSNSSGNTTITVDDETGSYVAVTAVTGSGSTTRIMILATSGSPVAGARILHRVTLPATAEITLEWRDATSGGTLLTSLLTDGSGDDAVAEFYFDGSAWQFLRFNFPANA